jgi:hypothetical protein
MTYTKIMNFTTTKKKIYLKKLYKVNINFIDIFERQKSLKLASILFLLVEANIYFYLFLLSKNKTKNIN